MAQKNVLCICMYVYLCTLIWKKENSELYFNLYRAQKVWFTLMIGDDRQTLVAAPQHLRTGLTFSAVLLTNERGFDSNAILFPNE